MTGESFIMKRINNKNLNSVDPAYIERYSAVQKSLNIMCVQYIKSQIYGLLAIWAKKRLISYVFNM